LDAEMLLAMAADVFLRVIMLLVLDSRKLTVSMNCDNSRNKLTFSYLSVNDVNHCVISVVDVFIIPSSWRDHSPRQALESSLMIDR
jgi:hypothetical protein